MTSEPYLLCWYYLVLGFPPFCLITGRKRWGKRNASGTHHFHRILIRNLELAELVLFEILESFGVDYMFSQVK